MDVQRKPRNFGEIEVKMPTGLNYRVMGYSDGESFGFCNTRNFLRVSVH